MKRLRTMNDLATLMKAGGPYIGPRGGKYVDPQHKIPWNDKPFDPPARVKGCKSCSGLGHRIGKQSRIDGKADAVSAPCPTCNPKGSFPLNRGEVKRRGLPQPLPTEGEKQRAGSKDKKRARDARYRKRKKQKKTQAKLQTDLFARPGEQQSLALSVRVADLVKAGGPYIGPRGGKYADPQHTVPWKDKEVERGSREHLSAFRKYIAEKHGVKLDISHGEHLVLSRIVVPEEKRGQGLGSKVMSDVHRYADAQGKTVALSPSTDFGGTKSGLKRFYKRHGYVENKGSKKNYEISETMYREPKLKKSHFLVKARKLHYKTTFRGLPISIENRKGSYRYWWDEHADEQGRTKMKHPYGYVRGTEGTDGDHLDVYLGPNEDAAYAYVVDQGKKGKWGEFDEQKVMLGFDNATAAKNAYLDHYNDPRFFQSMQAIPMDLFLETVTDPKKRGERIQKGGKYVRRVPYTDSKGRKRYRYYYSRSSVARDATAGEVVRLGKRLVKVLAVDGDTGAITIQVGSGKSRTVTPGEWGKLIAQHHGSYYRRWAEKRARSVIDAVQRHVPKELLEDLQGATDKERLADLQKKAPKVYAKLKSSFARAGLSVHSAKRTISRVMERRGWDSDARALAIGSVIKKDTGSGEIDQLIRASENLSDGWGVKAGHVASAVEMRKGDFVKKTNQLADQSEKEVSKLEAAMEKAKHGSVQDAAAVLAQSLDASAMHQLVQLLQAHPGLKMDAVDKARTALLEVPSAAPAKGPKTVGSETVLFVSELGQAKALRTRYKLMEAGDVVASHDPAKGFKKRDDYPEGVQERAYHKDRAEQQKVVGNALKLRPEIVVNTNPDAVNGPPMVTPDGHALGGNSRTMSMQKVYADHPEKAAELREYLKKNAHQFGLTEADVDAMENPILVREMIPEDDKGYSKEEMQLLVRQMNESFTQAMDPRTMQVALGRKLKQSTLDTLAGDMKEGETLNDFLSSSRADDFLKALERDGVIDSRNANQYRKRMSGGKLGRLNEDGKTLVSRILVGRIVGDADTLSNTQPSVIKSVAMAVPALSRAAKKGADYDLGASLALALEARTRIAARGNLTLKGGVDDMTFRRAIGELDDMFDPHPVVKDPLATKVLEVLLKRPGSRQLPGVFGRYADLVSRESDADQGGLLGIQESRSAMDLLTRALEESPAETKKSIRFGVPRSVLQKGYAWETGPRGGKRRRVPGGWVYQGSGAPEGGIEPKDDVTGREAKILDRMLKEAKSGESEKLSGAAQARAFNTFRDAKAKLETDLGEGRVTNDMVAKHLLSQGTKEGERAVQAVVQYTQEQKGGGGGTLPPEVAKATGVKTGKELAAKLKKKPPSRKARKKLAAKAKEFAQRLLKKGRKKLAKRVMALADGLLRLANGGKKRKRNPTKGKQRKPDPQESAAGTYERGGAASEPDDEDTKTVMDHIGTLVKVGLGVAVIALLAALDVSPKVSESIDKFTGSSAAQVQTPRQVQTGKA